MRHGLTRHKRVSHGLETHPDGARRRGWWAALAVLLAATAACGTAAACPFCSAPTLSLSQQLAQTKAAVTVVWKSAVKPDGQSVASTTFTVKDVVAGNSPVAPGEEITVTEYRAGDPGDLFLLLSNDSDLASEAAPSTFGDAASGFRPQDFAEDAVGLDSPSQIATGRFRWSTPVAITPEAAEYIARLPRPNEEDATPEEKSERLAFFLDYLEHPDDTISNDAYSEFSAVPYDVIVRLTDRMPVEKLRSWITSDDPPLTRLGLYGLMLGLAGDESDKALMERQIVEDTDDFRLGIDGIMGGYLLLAGEPGLALLEREKFENTTVEFSETYSAMRAVEFLWTDADDRFSKDRLRQSMRKLLDRPELADLVISTLSRWNDWSQVDEVFALYNAEGYDVGSIRKAITRFMMVALKAEEDPPTAAQKAKAKEHLDFIRKTDPRTVKAAERFFFLDN